MERLHDRKFGDLSAVSFSSPSPLFCVHKCQIDRLVGIGIRPSPLISLHDESDLQAAHAKYDEELPQNAGFVRVTSYDMYTQVVEADTPDLVILRIGAPEYRDESVRTEYLYT